MSAYLVSDNHINVIVSYFAHEIQGKGLYCKVNGEYAYLTPENAKYVAYELYRENVRSVDRRYNEHNSDELYNFEYLRHVKDVYNPLEISGALDCLEYQSCERDDYNRSEAYRLLHNMRKHLLRQMADRKYGNETTWSIDKVKPAKYEYLPGLSGK